MRICWVSLTLEGRYNVLFIMFEYFEPRNIDFYRSIIVLLKDNLEQNSLFLEAILLSTIAFFSSRLFKGLVVVVLKFPISSTTTCLPLCKISSFN